MKNKIPFFILLVSIHFSLIPKTIERDIPNKPPLTIWIRSFGNESASLIKPYLEQIEDELSEDFELKILVATKPQDPVLKVLEEIQQEGRVIILQANLDSISLGLNTLIESSSSNDYVLSISQGVEIHANHIKDALPWLENGAWVFGWELSNLQNDGSLPGKGWYHTAALYPPATLSWMKSHLFPDWIDNGVDGWIVVDGEKIPIGNNEEVVLMARVLQEWPRAFFVHNTRDVLRFSNQTGNRISFAQKIARKVPVAAYYLKNRLHMNPEDVWSHLVLIESRESSSQLSESLLIP